MAARKLTRNQTFEIVKILLSIVAIVISIYALLHTQDIRIDIDNLKSNFAEIKELQTNILKIVDNNSGKVIATMDYNGSSINIAVNKD